MTAHDPAHPVELARVTARIGAAILAWCADRFARGLVDFHMVDLEADIRERLGGAPDSTSRILRSLRQRGALEYVVVSRSASHYRIVRVGEARAA